MKRLHVHVAVADLEASIRFYSGLFAAAPAVREHDYAKWLLDDPRVNFAISARGKEPGIEHLGIQAEDAAELGDLRGRLAALDGRRRDEAQTTCCYAVSDKSWVVDPAGNSWELFHTLGRSATFGSEASEEPPRASGACCAPTGEAKPAQAGRGCCGG